MFITFNKALKGKSIQPYLSLYLSLNNFLKSLYFFLRIIFLFLWYELISIISFRKLSILDFFIIFESKLADA